MATSAGNIPISATFGSAQLEKDVLAALNRIQSKSSLTLNTKNFSQPLGKITGQANEFQKSLEASNARVIAFGASAGVIYNVQKAFSALVSSTIEVEKSLTDINIVLNTSSSGIRQFGDQLFNVAKQTGSSFKDVAAAATEFSRQGLGLEETLRRTRDALVLTRLSGLDVVSSTEALTSAVNSFTKEALTTTEVVNKLAAVDARFAVSSRDLSEAIQRVGSSASEAGVSFDELLGIVTSVQQTTARGGAVIGNALKTIFTRIERPQVINDLRDFGVTVTDLSGNALPAIKVLENLSQSFQNLSPVVKSQVAELVGGVYQINILKASLADLSKENSVFAGATNASSRAVDEAIVKNKALNESLSALLSETTANATQFAAKVGSVSVAPGIRKVLGFINDQLSSVNDKDSESVGAKIGTGIISGITNFITGPGVAIGIIGLGKLFVTFSKFARDAGSSFLGLNTISQQQGVLQEGISAILTKQPTLMQQMTLSATARLNVEKEVTKNLLDQSALLQGMDKSSLVLAKTLMQQGIGADTKGRVTKGKAGGYIPMQDRVAEVSSAAKGGYVAGNVVNAPASVGGVMNTAETVKYVPGFSQPFILPPAGSKAASSLASRSMSQTGVNPYMAKGYVPNFAPTIEEWYNAKRNAGQLKDVGLEKDKEGNWKLTNFGGATLNSAATAGVPIEDIRKAASKPANWLPFQSKETRDVERAVTQLPPYQARATMLTLESPQDSGQMFQTIRPNVKLVRDKGEKPKKDLTQEEIAALQDDRRVDIAFKVINLGKEILEKSKVDLRKRADNSANEILTDFANSLPGGEKATDKSREKFLGLVQNPAAQFAGKLFEAGINLSRDYVRDAQGQAGGDFDIRGGANIGRLKELFPGFNTPLGDYKLVNNIENRTSFAKKVTAEESGLIKVFEDQAKFDSRNVDIVAAASKLKASRAGGKAFGFIPNFNPVQEAIGREMSAGYSSSQVKLGQNSQLKTSFNPSGLGVYNTTEGSLGNGISLAKKAGINPQTKGMAEGFIPNFADEFDISMVTVSLIAFGSQLKSLAGGFKEINTQTQNLIKSKRSEISEAGNAVKKLKKEAESKFSFSNIDKDLNVTGPLRTSGGQMVNKKQKEEFESIKAKVEEQRAIARASAKQQSSQEYKIATASYTNLPLSLKEGGKLNNLIRSSGTGAGLAAAGALNIAEQFVPESDKKTKAAFSGAADVAQYAGLGAAFGPVGAAAGALIGVGIAAKKIVDSKAEQAIFDISTNLDKVKESSSKFSGASQTYATSLESLQNALNDPKTQPQALLKFQTSITDSLASIPNEFRGRVLAAGTDIGKVADAIARVNKEMSDAQQSLERQLAITNLIKDKTGIFAGNDLKKTDQDQLNRLFIQSIDPQKVLSNFKGGAGEFGSFVGGLKNSAFKSSSYMDYTTSPENIDLEAAPKRVTTTSVNKEALAGIKSQLATKGLLSPELAAKFEEVSKNISVDNVKSLFDAIDEFGKGIFSSKEASGNLLAIQKQNIETAKKSAEIIKNLTLQYENLNFSLSNQIEAEKSRATTIRELNKIEAEGNIQLATARTKGALNLAAPFMTESAKFGAESNLEVNQINNKRNSEIRSALDKALSSFSDTISKKAEEIRGKAFGSVTDTSRSQDDITKELNVFNKNIQQVTPLVSRSLKELSGGGDIEKIKADLITSITGTKLFKKPEAELIAGQLNNSFEELLNELTKITQQGDYDLAIQKVNSDYQKRSLALSEKLSLAGGAAALGNTGQSGVSEMFDKLTELTSSLAQSNKSGTSIQKGSDIFKLLDTIANQYNIRGAGVGKELSPLTTVSIKAREEQIKKENQRGKDLTNIALIEQTGRGIESGGALDKAFSKVNEDAARTAINQISAQLKLENIGSYFDLLTLEAEHLNELTKAQTKILEKQAPDISKAFTDVTTTQVGAKLDILNISLISALKELNVTQADIEIKKQIQNLLPIDNPQKRAEALSQITNYKGDVRGQSLTTLSEMTGVPLENIKLIQNLNQERKDLREYGGTGVRDSKSVFSAIKDSSSLKEYQSQNATPYSGPLSPNFKYQNSESPAAGALTSPSARLMAGRAEMAKASNVITELENAQLKEINEYDKKGNQKLADQLLLKKQIADNIDEINTRLNKEKFATDRLYNTAYGDTFFKEEKAARMNARIEENARLGKVDIGGITEKNTTYNKADFAKDTGQLIDTFQTDFKSGIGSAFGEAIKGTKTLKDAFRDMFQGILNRMLDKSLEMGVDALFAFGKAYATGRKDGGPIKGYNSGGMVTGGSGMKDDVPAMMSGGEYVIKKSSVNKYGTDYLRNLNGGIIPRYATGGFSVGPLQNEFLYDNPDRPTSGEYAVDSRLSAAALTDDSNPQNKLRQDRYEKLDQYLQDRAQYEADKKQSLKNYKNQVNSTFYSGLAAAGVQIASAGLTMGAEKLRTPKATVGKPYQAYSSTLPNYTGKANGGYIARFAGGGSTGQDNIPALLMGGEYVMNKKAVDMYGKDFMGQLNSGSLPKYASGGMVGTSYSGQTNTDQSSSMDELVAALNTLNDNLTKDSGITQSESGRASAAGATQESGMSVVNNISINMSQGGEVTSEANSSTQKGASNSKNDQNSMQNNGKLAELLRSKVVEVLVEQKRPGGLLYASR